MTNMKYLGIRFDWLERSSNQMSTSLFTKRRDIKEEVVQRILAGSITRELSGIWTRRIWINDDQPHMIKWLHRKTSD